jgi:hypothetical protein
VAIVETKLRAAIKAHLGKYLGAPVQTRELRGNPLKSSPIQYLEIPYFWAEPPRTASVFATVGASLYEMEDGGRVEGLWLTKKAPEEERFEQIFRVLMSFAGYAEATGSNIDMGDVLPAERMLQGLVPMSSLLLLPPVPIDKDLAHLQLEQDTRVDFFWLLPIYPAEAALVHQAGPQALMALFVLEHADPTDLSRKALDTTRPIPSAEAVAAALKARAAEPKKASYHAESGDNVITITRRGARPKKLQ